ncbi:MAG TPA: hypothetical protein VKU02_19710 [Gemmataceae bacterium]|nr:hypothetical protein [Gemmataceae bacterium]
MVSIPTPSTSDETRPSEAPLGSSAPRGVGGSLRPQRRRESRPDLRQWCRLRHHPTSPYTDGAHSVLIQPNGEIIALGGAQTSSAGAYEFAAERYNPDGSLDTSFGSGGVAVASFGPGTARGPSSALYPQAGTANDGKIVQEGYYIPQGGGVQSQILARYNTNGTLDSTFGTGGEVMTTFPGVSNVQYGWGVVVTSRGQIVALSADGSGHFELARYNTDGSLDTTFGQGGYVITTVPGGTQSPGNCTLLQQPDGTLIVTACTGANGSGGTWDIYGFNANGTLNTSFGNQGIVTTTAPGGPDVAALYFNAGPTNDGQVVVMGGSDSGTKELVRYNANGSLDTTFGTGGLAQTPFSFLPVQAAVDASGRFVAVGSTTTNDLARFIVNGTPDTTFGNGGLVTTTFGNSSQGLGVAIYPNAGTANDGDIVVVGSSSNGAKNNVLVARYLAQATSPYFQITGTSSVTAGTAGTYTMSVFNPDGSADTSYSGTVHITSSDSKAVLPANFTINGDTATFSATLYTAGAQSLTATDTVTSGINGSDASITITPAAAASLSITGLPSSVKVGTASTFTVTALDAYGNTASSYLGTVHFSSSDSKAKLPRNYTFTAGDNGSHTFTNGVTFETLGTQTLTATDTATSTIKGTATVQVVKSLTVQPLTASSPRVGTANAGPTQPISANLILPLPAGTGTTTSTDAASSESSSAALWQQADALALQRLDAWLSMEAGAMGVTKDTLMRDFFFTNLSASNSN